MTNRSPHKATPATHVQLPVIYAYGFEKRGFSIPKTAVPQTGFEIHFLSYRDGRRLDSCDGLIFPSGLFETFTSERGHLVCQSDYPHLYSRFREVVNLLDKGGWVVCLVGSIVDELSGEDEADDISRTDLIKVLLKSHDFLRMHMNTAVPARPKNDHFRTFIARWGMAQTVFVEGDKPRPFRVLAEYDNLVVGIDIASQILCLPFHCTRHDPHELVSIVTDATKSTLSYLRTRRVALPEWVYAFTFAAERTILQEYAAGVKHLSALETERSRWRGYKGVLVRTGNLLAETVVAVFSTFFGLKVDVNDDFVEDLAIVDQEGQPTVIVEVKGTKGGIKREYISQVDSHRERRQLPTTLPGLLIINDFMTVADFTKRNDAQVDKDHIQHARKMNVLVVRSVHLLQLMRDIESLTEQERRDKFMSLCRVGGGILFRDTSGEYSVLGTQPR